MTFNSMDTRIY